MPKKKILLLIDWYEPGYKAGGPIQSCVNFVSAMQDAFDLYIITSDRDMGEQIPYKEITADQWVSGKGNVQIYYANTEQLNRSVLERLINSVDPDYLYINSMYSYRFTILPLWLKWLGKIKAGLVVAPRGMLHPGAMKFKSVKKKGFITALNMLGIPKKLIFQATDEQEKKDIQTHFPSAKTIWVLPNFLSAELPTGNAIIKVSGELKCVYISRIVQKKNLLFFLDLLTGLRTSVFVRFDIYGEIEDMPYWEKCISLMEQLPPNVNAHYHGPIHHDEVYTKLEEHHLFVLPTRGENFGHAIMEAFATARPVLISDQTPWRQLEEKKMGWDIPLSRPEQFVHALHRAAGFDQLQFDEWSAHALNFAREYRMKGNLKEDYLTLFD